MKNLLLTLMLVVFASTTIKAIEIDTLWLRIAGAGVQELDFTPDDKYVIAWTNAIEFWEKQQGVKEFSIPIDVKAVGDFNYNKEILVFAKDSTPKLLDWETKDIIEGFEKQETFLGRIRTAKSKNEFMATKGHHPKVIYFWDINQKQILDSIEIMKEFEKNNQKWGRSIHEYDYVGNNDEYFYIRINDNNALTSGLNPKYEVDNFSYLIYSRETKELVDSLFAFQVSFENYNHVDKMVVMNDRTNLAWNNKGGEINFYNVIQKRFYKKFFRNDFSMVNDIEFNNDDKLISLTYGVINVFDLDNSGLFASFNTRSSYGQCKLSQNKQFMIGSVGSILIMHPVTLTSVETNALKSQTTISPNPTSSIVNIELNCSEPLVDYKITDINGATVSQATIANQFGSLQIDFSAYTTGVYFLTINCNEPMTYKIIKE